MNTQSDLPIDPDSVAPIVCLVLANEEEPADELAIHFVTAAQISQLHADHFDDATVTDCITFPIDEEDEAYRLLGEVFVCPKVAMDYVEKNEGEPYDEATLYLVHGLLHLCGYDDIDEEKEPKMRQAEQRHMNILRETNQILQCP